MSCTGPAHELPTENLYGKTRPVLLLPRKWNGFPLEADSSFAKYYSAYYNLLLTRASDPPFVDHSTIPRVDITEMNTRARFSKSICTKHSPQQHFPIGHLRCYNFFVVTKLSPSSFKVTFCCLLPFEFTQL